MWCPFLKETEVRFCEASPFRKPIERLPLPAEREPCSSPSFPECPLAAGRPEARLARSSCPFLRTSRMLFCAATPVHRYVPYSDAIVSPCQGDGHYYCEDYLSLADPDRDRSGSGRTEGGVDPAQEAADVARDPEVRPWLFYAPNHLWLDRRADATCIVGLDAFAARLLGRVDDVTFVVTRGVRRPSLTLSVRGVDLHLVFPNPLELTGINVAVREDPGRIVSDPYLRGWLFRGRDAAPAPAGSGSRATLGLRTGKEAVEWMQGEWEEAARRFHDWLALRETMETRVLADGGAPASAPASLLGRQDLLVLVGRFFLSGAGREA